MPRTAPAAIDPVELAAYLDRLVEDAPPLTPEQKENLAVLWWSDAAVAHLARRARKPNGGHTMARETKTKAGEGDETGAAPAYLAEVTPADAANLPADDPNVAANSDEVEDHESMTGELLDDDDEDEDTP